MAFARAHHLWSIAEVVREIIKQAADDQHTLAQCARVSRNFSEPALELLWEELKGLDRLLALLPASFKKVEIGSDLDFEGIANPGPKTHSFLLYDGIRDEQWERLEYYGRLVRVYSDEGSAVDNLSASSFVERLSGRVLFPRLKHLEWKRPFDASTLLVAFMSPTLRSVRLDLLPGGTARTLHYRRRTPSASEYAYGPALQLVHSHAPRVNVIQLCTSGFSCSLNRLHIFTNLRVLELRQLCSLAPVFDACRSLPLLSKLDVQFARPLHTEPAPGPAPLPKFTHKRLQALKLNGPSPMVLAAVDAIHVNLQNLGLTFEADEDAWKRCMALLAPRFGTGVRGLKVTVEEKDDSSLLLSHSFHDWFAPLYAFRHLRSARISSNYEILFTITARDVLDMARAWPRLEAFCVETGQDEPSEALPILALEAFAKKCVHLTDLVFPLPHHGLLSKYRSGPMPEYKNTMACVDLHGGKLTPEIEEQCRVYVQKLFPNAHRIMLGEDFDSSDDEGDVNVAGQVV